MSLFKTWGASALLAIVSTPSLRAEHASERLPEAAAVLSEIMNAPDQGIPQDLLEKAQCVVIIPRAKKAAFSAEVMYGDSWYVATRTGPGCTRMEGGSVGLKWGVAESDIVLLVMNRRGMDRLLENKFTIGGAAQAAAGLVGQSYAGRAPGVYSPAYRLMEPLCATIWTRIANSTGNGSRTSRS